MQRIDGQGNVTGRKRNIFQSPWFGRGAAIAAATAAAILAVAKSDAALIAPITSNDVPINNSASVFDTSNAGNSYSLGAGTTLIPAGFDTRDLFGGSFGTFGAESNDIIFENYQPMGTVETVNVSLSSATSLTGFNLYMEDDGPPGQRSASEFLLYGDGQLIDDVPILDTTGTESYTSVYGSNYIELSDQFAGLSPSTNYTLEFAQNGDAGNSSGVRALEFQATGTVPSSVPEPTSVAGLFAGGIAMLSRRGRGINAKR